MHDSSDAPEGLEAPNGTAEPMAHDAVDVHAGPAGEAASIESLPLAERAPRYQAAADRLRDELERSDPARGDA
ncbi:hypothetical protein GE115_13145 [Agromyces sp. CFH 90414]|uniref:Uncharacterized protein n=1 Tax=Agromyces agglutinans TaxID=2662258 RepID=A0A6I2F984_9MICO|nr:hypothetical protein [Agromyces agglutinans]MRG60804.1 hypothetical protein [Agromyces agglutinans]